MKKQKILVITGPTASGKSALAVELARAFNGAVISADSRQVYKGLDIGTGKITKREMKGVPHYCLDLASPKKTLTAHDFVLQASRSLERIVRADMLPIVAGGTGFYIDALLGGVALPSVAPDPALRSRLGKKSVAELFSMLRELDPSRAKRMDTPSERNNKVRLIRAIEIARALGTQGAPDKKGMYEPLWIGITLPLKALEKRIHTRLMARMKAGMAAEAKRLHEKGLSYKRMDELGLEYRALAQYLQGKISKAEMLEALERDIRRYAKRQLTYWKRNKKIQWFSPKDTAKIRRSVHSWLTQ